jgi:tetratricopeptide (TPR) repeat protein
MIPSFKKEIAYNYFLNGEYDQAAAFIKPLTEREDADVQTFQIAGNIYNAKNERKESLKIYKKGIKKFPNSGALHFEYGEVLLMDEQRDEAIEQWETGIDVDPSYSGNYYHAAKFYAFNKMNVIRTILYSEIFVNLESYTIRTTEIKDYLLKAYKMFYTNGPESASKKPIAFETAVYDISEQTKRPVIKRYNHRNANYYTYKVLTGLVRKFSRKISLPFIRATAIFSPRWHVRSL